MKPSVAFATLSSLIALAVMHGSLRQDIPPPSPLTRTAACVTASPRISIPDLLNPETQLATFQKYRIQTDEAEAKYLDFEDLSSFHKWHSGFRFILIGAKFHQGCLVSWHSGDDWDATATAKKDPDSQDILFPYNLAEFVIFSEDGSPVSKYQPPSSAGWPPTSMAMASLRKSNTRISSQMMKRDPSSKCAL
jgi:hypothetical protein